MEEDIAAALEWRSEPLLEMALLHSHGPSCTRSHAVHEAVFLHHVVALEFLLSSGPRDLEEPCRGATPLLRATRCAAAQGDGGYEMVQMLIKHGALVNSHSEDLDRETPLHHAAACGHIDVIALLLANRADPNLADAGGKTALHAGCRHWAGPLSLPIAYTSVELLMSAQADPRRRDALGLRPREHLVVRHSFDSPPPARPAAARTCLLERLDRECRWRDRHPAVYARGRGRGAHWLCRMPDLIFRHVVGFL